MFVLQFTNGATQLLKRRQPPGQRRHSSASRTVRLLPGCSICTRVGGGGEAQTATRGCGAAVSDCQSPTASSAASQASRYLVITPGSMEMASLPHDAVQLVDSLGRVVPWPQVKAPHHTYTTYRSAAPKVAV